MTVFVRDLLCRDIMDGFVERGGEGRYDNGGVSRDVRELITVEVGAIDGDWRGECTGGSFENSSERTGGRRGVVAWLGSSWSEGFRSISIG